MRALPPGQGSSVRRMHKSYMRHVRFLVLGFFASCIVAMPTRTTRFLWVHILYFFGTVIYGNACNLA